MSEPQKKPDKKMRQCQVCFGYHYGAHPFHCSSPRCRLEWRLDREEIERHNR